MESSNNFSTLNLEQVVMQYGSQDALSRYRLIEEYAKDPVKLLDLFDAAIEKIDQECVLKTDLITRISNKIDELDTEKKFDQNQINKILAQVGKMNSDLVQGYSYFRSPNFWEPHNFCEANFSMENVFNFLKIAKEAKLDGNIEKAIDFISKKAGFNIIFDKKITQLQS